MRLTSNLKGFELYFLLFYQVNVYDFMSIVFSSRESEYRKIIRVFTLPVWKIPNTIEFPWKILYRTSSCVIYFPIKIKKISPKQILAPLIKKKKKKKTDAIPPILHKVEGGSFAVS